MDKETFTGKLLSMEYELSRYAFKLTMCEEDSQDLLQETFLKVLSNKHTYREQQNFRAWVYAIMKNQFINEYRKEKNRNVCDYIKSDSEYLHNILSINPENKLTVKEILKEINRLPLKLRKPFKMFISGYMYKEISENIEIPLGTAKNRIFEARKILTKNIERYETVL